MRIIPKGDSNTTGIWIRDYDLAEETLVTQSMPELNLVLGLLREHRIALQRRLSSLTNEQIAYGCGDWPSVPVAELERAKAQLQLVTAMLREANREETDEED